MFRKTTVELHDGSIVVQPDYPLELTETLRYWRRTLVVDEDTYKRSVYGRYEELYKEFAAYDHSTNVLTRKLVTMPGFAKLVRDTLTECGWEVTLVDKRLPMPPPNIPAAMQGLYDHQKPCAYTALMSGGGIIACPTGWGKCVGPETLQMYYDGTVKRANEVKVGDVLMGDDCTPRTVLERVDGQGPMYRITPKVGQAFTAADHHILCLTPRRGHVEELPVSYYAAIPPAEQSRYSLYRSTDVFKRGYAPPIAQYTSFTVERIEDGPYVGVMLDGNGRYLLGDGTVTHNTHIMAALIKGHTAEALQLRGTPITIVATPDKDITLKDYEDLTELLPDREVGLIMSGRNRVSDDVQVITLNSLHRIEPLDVGVVIVDEVHASASDARAEAISKFTLAAKWGVSASPTGRFDGKDKVTEGLFGPVVYHRTYQQGVADGALVPIVVYWVKAPEPSIGLGSYLAYKTRDAQYRHGVRRSLNQNRMVADILKRIPESMQTLCIMQFIDQMDALMVHCDPGMRYVHAQTSQDKALERTRNLGAISAKERRQIYADMNAGVIRQILSTHVYKQGVNFPQLEVVINAGGGGSDIVATQIPGRQSRKIEGKDQSFLVDFWHPWDTVEKGGKDTPGPILKDDHSRRRAYKKLGFEQIWVDDVNDLPFLKGTQSKT